MSPSRTFPGDLEWMVLLTILKLGEDANALAIREEMIELAGRDVSRGTLYKTLSRMQDKGWLAWDVDETDIPERGGLPRRCFRVTAHGLTVVRSADEAFRNLRDGLEDALGGAL